MNRKELSAIKGRIKDIFRRNIKDGGLVFVLSVICLCFVLIHYSDDKLSDTSTVNGVVTDVKHHYSRTHWLTFKVGDVECYYMILDAGSEKTETVIEKYEQLERSGKTISALTIEDWDFNYIDDGDRVVGVVGEKGQCFSLASHNKSQKEYRVGFSIPPLFMIAFSSYFLLLDIKNEIIIPARKRKIRIARKQERKAKFAAQALEQGQSPPQTKPRNKSKKSR